MFLIESLHEYVYFLPDALWSCCTRVLQIPIMKLSHAIISYNTYISSLHVHAHARVCGIPASIPNCRRVLKSSRSFVPLYPMECELFANPWVIFQWGEWAPWDGNHLARGNPSVMGCQKLIIAWDLGLPTESSEMMSPLSTSPHLTVLLSLCVVGFQTFEGGGGTIPYMEDNIGNDKAIDEEERVISFLRGRGSMFFLIYSVQSPSILLSSVGPDIKGVPAHT